MLRKTLPVRLFGSDAARALHRAFPPIDLHADPLLWARLAGYDLARRHSAPFPRAAFVGHVDIPRLEDACMGAQFLGLVAAPHPRHGAARAVAEQLDILDGVLARESQRAVRAISAEDIERANAEGRIAFLTGIEGAHCLSGELEHLEAAAGRGVRYLGLAHFSANKACRPSMGVGRRDRCGLTAFGRDAVRFSEEVGIIVDVAHVNGRTVMEVCAMARRPVIASHVCMSGAHPHWRGIDDDQLRAIADTGGLVGIMYARRFLGGDMSALVRHVLHAVRTAGIDHVALGSDFDGMIVPVRELRHAGMLPNLTDALLRAGLGEGEIGKILRMNVLRVLRDAPPKRL